MIIDRCPRFVQRFFGSRTAVLSKPQQGHLWRMVLAIAISTGGSKLVKLAATILGGRHRTRLGGFLRDADWDAPGVLREQALATLRWMRPRRGETVELLLDDTRVAKRGRRMAALQKIWDHAHRRFVRGHIWVVAAIRFRGVVLPWRLELWKPRQFAGRQYRKTTDIAAQIITTFDLPWRLQVRVLFDAFYLCPSVTRSCENKRFSWFSVAARNRTFTRDRNRRAKLGRLAPGWLRHEARTVRMPRARGYARMRIASADGYLARIGMVRLVASKRPQDPWRNLVVFATNARLDARVIVSVYERRWDIEPGRARYCVPIHLLAARRGGVAGVSRGRVVREVAVVVVREPDGRLGPARAVGVDRQVLVDGVDRPRLRRGHAVDRQARIEPANRHAIACPTWLRRRQDGVVQRRDRRALGVERALLEAPQPVPPLTGCAAAPPENANAFASCQGSGVVRIEPAAVRGDHVTSIPPHAGGVIAVAHLQEANRHAIACPTWLRDARPTRPWHTIRRGLRAGPRPAAQRCSRYSQ